MPIITKCDLPANEILRKEQIQILEGAEGKDTVQIAILNAQKRRYRNSTFKRVIQYG